MSEEQAIVPLVTESGEELDMVVVVQFEHEGTQYALLEPADLWVDVIRVQPDQDEGDFEQIEPAEFTKIAQPINEALKEWNVEVKEHADELLLVGEPPDEFFEDCPMLDVETDDEEQQEYMVLMEVDTGEQTYLVVAQTEQRVFPVRLVDGQGHMLEDEEFEKLHVRFEQALDEAAEADEE